MIVSLESVPLVIGQQVCLAQSLWNVQTIHLLVEMTSRKETFNSRLSQHWLKNVRYRKIVECACCQIIRRRHIILHHGVGAGTGSKLAHGGSQCFLGMGSKAPTV